MNNAWGGIDKGVHIVGGDTNMGKSSLLRMMAWDIMRNNPKAHVRFYTLDDSEEYFLDSMIAQAAKVPINAVNKPDGFKNKAEDYYKRADYERMVERGTETYEKFLAGQYLHNFSFVGTATLQSADWRVIRDDIKIVKAQLPEDFQLVVFIDNFHDIDLADTNSDDTNGKTEKVATEVHKLAEQEDLVIIGTAELKKNSQRRPILDDIYGSRKWKYKARTILLIYSEVGAGKHNPRLYYERLDKPHELSSVLEVHFAKAKGDSFKGRLFYHQITEMGLAVEVPVDQAKQYAMLIA
jgi:replicative DNA helicase